MFGQAPRPSRLPVPPLACDQLKLSDPLQAKPARYQVIGVKFANFIRQSEENVSGSSLLLTESQAVIRSAQILTCRGINVFRTILPALL